MSSHLHVRPSGPLSGTIKVLGAKNAALVTIASLLLTDGISVLKNVPGSADVMLMIELLESLGAQCEFNYIAKTLEVDTRAINSWKAPKDIVNKMRASILVMGPLLARFGKVEIVLPGGDAIGERPIDYHVRNFAKMGVFIAQNNGVLCATTINSCLKATKLVLEYPSVGATENLLLAGVKTVGMTTLVNAALEPEVLDLIKALRLMGANIEIKIPATLVIEGVSTLHPIEHTIMPDRLEAGGLLMAAAATGGSISVLGIQEDILEVVLSTLQDMGHHISGDNESLTLVATDEPCAVSIKTGPYPCFPTDLQAPMMVLQTLAYGDSVIEETVYENRFLHVTPLQKMGACIQVEGRKAYVTGRIAHLIGQIVHASDIRASYALVLAACVANQESFITGLSHWRRGYDSLDYRMCQLGASIAVHSTYTEGCSFCQRSILNQAQQGQDIGSVLSMY